MDEEVDQKFELPPPTVDTSSRSNGGGAGGKTSGASSSSTAPQPIGASGPIPMSMPSILRNPGTSSHQQLGRRKQRRSDNARLLSNPHAVRPTIKDHRLHSNEIRSTFPSCSSGGKAQSVPVPSSSRVGYSEPAHDPTTANQGHFGKSLRDAQRVLKRLEMGNIDDEMIRHNRAGELERFIWLVDREIRTWAQEETFVFAPAQTKGRKMGKVLLDESFNFTVSPFGSELHAIPTVDLDSLRPNAVGGQLVEFQRTPNALVWLVHDPFLRLVVHCLARVSRCPSFSKDDVSRPGLRFTWILNKNPLARRSRRGRRVSVSSSNMSTPLAPNANAIPNLTIGGGGAMETPPTTDFDSQTESELDTDTDASELANSIAVPGVEEVEAAEGVDTDEEAEILRRVRRWAIDSHRQRAESHRDAVEDDDPAVREGGSSRSRPNRTKPKRTGKVDSSKEQQDPDQTLTATAIAEEDDEDEDEEDEARPLSDA
ncbi:hypothetical protein [Sporisorium scitamineum]|uniref:Uncharacterized protein n=1 Tax=Sporisorium scitamineum TaxID=49012 RepID=A0A0F7RVU9_9BASI|nr:hypothetical protein [Sporisorium scitamineum]